MCPCFYKVWSRIPTFVKIAVVVVGLVAGICTIFVHAHTIWRWIFPAEPTVQPVKVTNFEPTKPDFIPGTRATHAQMRNVFPFGYTIFSERDGRWTYDARPSEKYQWSGNWSLVKITPDFSRKCVMWEIPSITAIKSGSQGANEYSNNWIFFSVPLIPNFITLVENPVCPCFDNEPCLWVCTLNDDQRFPVFCIGFKIASEDRKTRARKLREYMNTRTNG
jgi:hypothetical protein